MNIWQDTKTGAATLRKIAKEISAGQRLMIVMGDHSAQPLMEALEAVGVRPACRIEEAENLTALARIDFSADGQMLILLHRIEGVAKAYAFLLRYCRHYGFRPLTAPYSLSAVDYEMLRQKVREEYAGTCPEAQWLTDIAHESALCVSAGNFACYEVVLRSFLSMYMRNGFSLPDVESCLKEYLDNYPSPMIEKIGRTPGGVAALLSEQDEASMIENWSCGMLTQYDGRWQSDPRLLSFGGFIRERKHRVLSAYVSTLTPVYMAYTLYAERRFGLSEAAMWYPATVCTEVRDRTDVDAQEKWMINQVRNMRNWLHHSDGSTDAVGYTPTKGDSLKTCAAVIRQIDRFGQPLANAGKDRIQSA